MSPRAHADVHLADAGPVADARVNELLEAVLAVGAGLGLQDALQRIVEVAVTLVGASYGALGVLDEHRTGLSQFVTVGMTPEKIAAVGPLPAGRGVLGEVIRNPRPMRLDDLGQHSASSGFPTEHPAMRTFLGVPVRVGRIVFGNLYLTEKSNGLAFSDEDESVLVALALAAGVAIQNARLYEDGRRRSAWVEAGREVSTSLLSGTNREDALGLVVERVRSVLDAELVFVAVCRDGRLCVEAASGDGAQGLLVSLDEPIRAVLDKGVNVDLTTVVRPGTAVPLGPPEQPAQRALVALWSHPGYLRSTEDLTAFASQAALALELADRRSEAERNAVGLDRDRIGRDLHDLVIQRLFATGMQLQSAVRLIGSNEEEAASRVNRAVDELDETIRELRSTIYGLQTPLSGRPSVRAQVLEVADAAAHQLGFAPTLHLEGLLDTLLTTEVAENVLATMREALSNAARHAKAQHVEVLVSVRTDQVRVRVEDDGQGMAQDGVRRGLRNLSVRAERLGGSLVVTSAAGAGTTLLWTVPL